MATLKNTTINDTGFLQVATGNTAQRPVSPSTGDLRYNTDIGLFEVYDSSVWQPFPLEAPSVAVGDFTSDFDEYNRLYYFSNDDGSVLVPVNGSLSINGIVRAIGIQSDGKFVIGGDFTSVGGTTRNYIARLNANGSLDTGFNPNLNNSVYAIKIDSNDKIYIGGSFTTVGGSTKLRIARLNTNGTLDTAFGSTTKPNPQSGIVYSIDLQSANRVVFGGNFSSCVNSSLGVEIRNLVTACNTSGDLTTFQTYPVGTDTTGISAVRDLKVQSNDAIVVVGNFNDASNRDDITRLTETGTNDGFPDLSPNLRCETVDIQSNGSIVFGGFFTNVGGVTRNRIARTNSAGTIDASFNPNCNLPVYAIAVQSDDKIVIGGAFTTIGGTAGAYLGRLHANGSIDTAFEATIPNGDVLDIGLN